MRLFDTAIGIFLGVVSILVIIRFSGNEIVEKPTAPFTSTIYLDINTYVDQNNVPLFGGDSIYYLEISGPDTGFVVPLATAWECAQGY